MNPQPTPPAPDQALREEIGDIISDEASKSTDWYPSIDSCLARIMPLIHRERLAAATKAIELYQQNVDMKDIFAQLFPSSKS